MKTSLHCTSQIETNPFQRSKTYLALLLSFFLLTSCLKRTDFSKIQDTPAATVLAKIDDNCVQVFYDKSTDTNYKLGRTYALMLLNLLGHFPEFQQIIGPVELYQKGDIEKCKATFYIGSYYDNTLSQDFLNDFKNTKRQAVWMGYNFWQLGSNFNSIFGYRDYEFTTLNTTDLASDGKPSFFRDVRYKGEIFTKYNKWNDVAQTSLSAAFEVAQLKTRTNPNSSTMAEIKHSFTGEIIPWAIKSKNHFYVTEVPFSFIHESDRYLVFADLLFDFLQAEPKHNAKHALLRIEDIHPYVDMEWFDKAISILESNNITPHISIVPIFRDPYFQFSRTDTRVEIPMEDRPIFFDRMKELNNSGSVFIWHGVTHQYNDDINPFSGTSGDDYEFWDSNANTPVAEDSTSYILNKLDYGFSSLKKAGIAPKLWLNPHYHASALDNLMFGQIFNWTIGRGVYSDFKIGGVKALKPTKPLGYDLTATDRSANRFEFFADLEVETVPDFNQFGQIYPYEIYGNIYSQKIIPENLGNVQPDLNVQVVATRTVDTILEDARRNLVLRDAWASVFYHAFLIQNEYDSNGVEQPHDLEKLVIGLKNLGYDFVNLNTYSDSNQTLIGKPRIELEEIR